MNSFSINRFWKTFSWVVATNFRTQMMWAIGAAVAVFLMEIIIIALDVSYKSYDISLRTNVRGLCSVFIMITTLVGLSTVFFNINKKAKREAFLMLPASNLEKFLSAVIYATVVWALSMFLAYVVGDTLRMVVRSLMYGNPWISTIPNVVENLTPNIFKLSFNGFSWAVMLEYFFAISLLFWVHSLYILGGTLLRKYAFVVSTIVMILSVMLTAWLVDKLQCRMFYTDMMEISNTTVVVDHVGFLGYVYSIATPLLAVFNYWASFHIFKGFQLITNKWTNYDILKR